MISKQILINGRVNSDVRHYDVLPSTNLLLKNEGCCHKDRWQVVIADAQTEGRGRLGRHFLSEQYCGLYMSVMIPQPAIDTAEMLTVISALAVCEAINTVTGVSPDIKWVNDILVGGKKVCGILTEGSYENGRLKYAIVGIGVNISPPSGGYPTELVEIAGAISDKYSDALRDSIAHEIVSNLEKRVNMNDAEAVYSEYRKRLCMLGHRVKVITPLEEYYACACELERDFSLTVKKDSGEMKNLFSGEISIRI